MVAGASVVKALSNLGVEASIKWPNDIIVHNKKICGILTELSAEMERVNYVVIGIGINIKTIDFPDEIKEKATSLYKEGYKLSRVDIVRQFCIEFEKLYKGYILNGNLIVKEKNGEIQEIMSGEVSIRGVKGYV